MQDPLTDVSGEVSFSRQFCAGSASVLRRETLSLTDLYTATTFTAVRPCRPQQPVAVNCCTEPKAQCLHPILCPEIMCPNQYCGVFAQLRVFTRAGGGVTLLSLCFLSPAASVQILWAAASLSAHGSGSAAPAAGAPGAPGTPHATARLIGAVRRTVCGTITQLRQRNTQMMQSFKTFLYLSFPAFFVYS